MLRTCVSGEIGGARLARDTAVWLFCIVLVKDGTGIASNLLTLFFIGCPIKDIVELKPKLSLTGKLPLKFELFGVVGDFLSRCSFECVTGLDKRRDCLEANDFN